MVEVALKNMGCVSNLGAHKVAWVWFEIKFVIKNNQIWVRYGQKKLSLVQFYLKPKTKITSHD